MTTPDRASWLVDKASDMELLIYSRVIGDEDGPPRWVRCIADGTDRRTASRITVVRADGEDCPSMWARVLSAIRQLKRSRGFQHRVTVLCMQSEPPADAPRSDSRWNAERALWHDVEHQRCAERRVKSLCALADLHGYRGNFPTFQ